MLRRYQILLTDWLGDLVKLYSEKYDVSFSETIRLMLCMQLEHLCSLRFPKHKIRTPLKQILKKLDEAEKRGNLQETHHKLMSEIYFEARKISELIIAQEQENKK